jgi:futalosine hydrolase
MNGLVISSTVFEITPFLELYRNGKTNPELDILITGIGITHCTYSLTKQIQIKRPAFVIQAGICGAFNKKIELGSVLAVNKEAIADQAVIEGATLKTIFDLKLADPDSLPYGKGWLVNNSSLIKKCKLKKVTAVSVNQITSSKKTIDLYKEKYKPEIESMEGAALHYTCLMENVPFLQLRSVSNYIGERNKKKWELEKSILNLNNELIHLLDHL